MFTGMKNCCYTLCTGRAASAVAYHPSRTVSHDGTRAALGRNAKRSLGDGRYDIVRIWTLKERVDGRWVTLRSGVGTERAAEFIGRPVSDFVLA